MTGRSRGKLPSDQHGSVSRAEICDAAIFIPAPTQRAAKRILSAPSRAHGTPQPHRAEDTGRKYLHCHRFECLSLRHLPGSLQPHRNLPGWESSCTPATLCSPLVEFFLFSNFTIKRTSVILTSEYRVQNECTVTPPSEPADLLLRERENPERAR